ncbi:hypothetical protein MRS44_005338 [Fusarium solani]|uniref:uncharacterized protein n=1 Tax=Fusarium solani TaxID=169388 RepID=UPI0032C4161D|nr:hypothetical protein MRS44_005338 [Fusarium solani]
MGRRPRIPEEEWEKWKETIERIYMVEQQTLKLLIQGMANTHGFIATEKEYRIRLEKWGFRKNNTQGSSSSTTDRDSDHARRRAAQALPSNGQRLILDLQPYRHQPSPEFRWSDNLEQQLWKMQIAIDTIIKGSFGSANEDEKWTSDKITLTVPSTELNHSRRWQHLNSQCTAFVALSGVGLYAQLRAALEQLKQDVKGLNMSLKPNTFLFQLIYMWRMCLELLKARLHLPRIRTADGQSNLSLNPLVPTFLGQWEKHLAEILGSRDPTCEIMAALLTIFRRSPERLKMGLERGYCMTIKGLERIVGSNNGIVLRMWSHYIKSSGEEDMFIEGGQGDKLSKMFRHISLHADQSYGPCSPEAISILHGYTEMILTKTTIDAGNLNSYHPVLPRTSNPTRLEDFAVEVRQRAKSSLEASSGLDYDLVAVEAYIFSTELLAKRLYQRANPLFSLELLDEAIDLLEHGNTECLIWAAMLSKTRVRLLGNKKDPKRCNLEKNRMVEIRARLPMIRPAYHQPFDWVGTSGRTRFLRERRQTARDEMIEDLWSMLDDLKLS